jgi:ABC transport system ATP-binding/permease protein
MFSGIQCALFTLVGNQILQIRGMFWPYWWFMFVTALSGIALGLLISSVVGDSKTAANFVPLVLIPQLIFGGALIKYEDMNRDLDVVYTFKRWFSTHPELSDAGTRDDAALRIPAISLFVATHYTYEALIVAQAKLNPLAIRQERIQQRIDRLVKLKQRTPEQAARLEDLKDTLAMLSGLESGSLEEIERRLGRVDKVIEGGELDPGGLRSRTSGITADRLYSNQKVNDLVAKAETEQSDYRRGRLVNVFFGPVKSYYFGPVKFGWKIERSVYFVNTLVLVVASLACLSALYWILKRQLRTRGL